MSTETEQTVIPELHIATAVRVAPATPRWPAELVLNFGPGSVIRFRNSPTAGFCMEVETSVGDERRSANYGSFGSGALRHLHALTASATDSPMGFGAALALLKVGKSVKRRSWPTGQYLYTRPTPPQPMPLIHTPDGEESADWEEIVTDIFAEDWIVLPD